MGIGPYGSIIDGEVRRADVGIGPYGSITRGAAKRAVGDAGPYGRLQVVRYGERIPQSRLRRASPL